MKLARLYIPKYPDAPVGALGGRLIEAFGGYTQHSFCIGAWRDPVSNVLVQEPVYVYDVVVGDEDHTHLGAILEEYKSEAAQKSVLYVFDNQPIFI